jgi:MFS transporter, DHA1 family, inner membrane transport protein
MSQTTEPRAGTAAEAAPAVRARHFWLAVIALAIGGFAIGTTEFVTMGVLPQVADGIGVSIPVAGHVISAYALGVVVGAPVLAFFGAKLPRRALLLWLMVAYAVFNALSALAPNYETLMVARFLDGLPHGGYFGVASLVAASMVAPERRGRAIAMVLMGLPIANVVGVPAATWLGQTLGWRASYWVVAALAALTIVMVLAFVPNCPGNPEATGRRELLALRMPQVWFAVVAGAVGFGGMFALFSYVAPMTTRVAGLPDSSVPLFLLTLGVGMVFGNWVAGRLMDWAPKRSLLGSPVALAVTLVASWLLLPHGYAALPALFLVTTVGSVLALGLMMRLIDASQHAETLGAALSHGSLNIGNALGAWVGGLTIAAGFVVLAVAFWLDRSDHSSAVTS